MTFARAHEIIKDRGLTLLDPWTLEEMDTIYADEDPFKYRIIGDSLQVLQCPGHFDQHWSTLYKIGEGNGNKNGRRKDPE